MDRKTTDRRAYDEARRAFENMEIEDRTIFLVEAAATTVARGVQEVGRIVADELGRTFGGGRPHPPHEPAEPGRPGAAEPSTGSQQAP